MDRNQLYEVVHSFTEGWPEHAGAIMTAVDEYTKGTPITGVYLNSEATVIVADIDVRQLPEEVQNFLNGNIVFRDQVLKDHMVGCSEFEEEVGYDDLSKSSKQILATITQEASNLEAAYIRLVSY
jgi:anthranilate/para-aminobenzoate synthase component II